MSSNLSVPLSSKFTSGQDDPKTISFIWPLFLPLSLSHSLLTPLSLLSSSLPPFPPPLPCPLLSLSLLPLSLFLFTPPPLSPSLSFSLSLFPSVSPSLYCSICLSVCLQQKPTNTFSFSIARHRIRISYVSAEQENSVVLTLLYHIESIVCCFKHKPCSKVHMSLYAQLLAR